MLPLTHGTAALGALCGFLEQCSTSSDLRIQYLSYKAETWTRAFNIYLTKSDNNKSKPLRRLLIILARLIFQHPVDTERDSLLGIAICNATRAIRKQHDFADIKPAIQVLEHFLSKGLIDAAEITQIKTPEELGLCRTKSMEKDNQNPGTQQEQTNQTVQKFALSVLEWIQYPDCAPVVGRFLPVFFKSLEESHTDDVVHNPEDGVKPLWVFPVKRTLERHQGHLDVFEIHILPGLFRLGPTHVKAFLDMLPFESIQHGNMGSSKISDIQLCLLVAKISEASSLRKHLGQGQSTSFDLENLGINLLEHSSSSVRISALSLLVSSSGSARPFSRRALRRVRQCIPYFHVEVNAKPRNEFIALMKKLCMRLRGATMSLLRRGQDTSTLGEEQSSLTAPSIGASDGDGRVSSGNFIEQALDDESHILEEHLAFRRWYMMFLLKELRPTASYQSHITALKMLDFLTEQTIALRSTSSKSRNDYFCALNENLPKGLFLRTLTDLLLDPFDDVRQSANTVFNHQLSMESILQISISKRGKIKEADSVDQEAKIQADIEEDYREANHAILVDLNEAENEAGITGRADHADGYGRLNNLLYTTSCALAKPARWQQSPYLIVDHIISTLQREVNVAKDDLLSAVSSIPLHGRLIALRYCFLLSNQLLHKLKEISRHIVSRTDYVKSLDTSLEKWEDFDRRIFSICSGVWEVVQDVLCFDAPEGHEISEDDFNEQDIGTKDILSFCWRALKESRSVETPLT